MYPIRILMGGPLKYYFILALDFAIIARDVSNRTEVVDLELQFFVEEMRVVVKTCKGKNKTSYLTLKHVLKPFQAD